MTDPSCSLVLDTSRASFAPARELLRLCPDLTPRERDPAIAVLMAVPAAEQEGHTHLLLSESDVSGSLTAVLPSILAADIGPAERQEITRLAISLIADKRLSAIIGTPGERKPLIRDGDILASHRSFQQELRLDNLLRERLSLPDFCVSEDLLQAVLAEIKPGLTQEQSDAVRLAVRRRLTVISGGPGTGKTTIVAALIACLLRLNLSVQDIGLAAPTGKAANRLEEAVHRSLPSWAAGSEPSDADRLHGVTLHRLLGVGNRVDRPAYHRGNPLPLRAVIVDEASMIDLGLMRLLLEALPDACRLILLGDADQLPAVENGAVFRDLVLPTAQSPDTPPWSCRLTHSFRMRADDPHGSGVLRLAGLIRVAGHLHSAPTDIDSLLPRHAAPDTLSGKGPEMLEGSGVAEIERFLAWWHPRYALFPDQLLMRINKPFVWDESGEVTTDRRVLDALFRQMQASKLLAATRQGEYGTESLNRAAALLLRRHLGRSDHEGVLAGEPFLMTRNDYLYDVFNGDHGLLLWAVTPTSPQPALHVVFQRPHGYQAIPYEALRHDLEPAYALTVHKSQGSEFDRVFFVLPPVDHPLLTREILYTAVTRAKIGVMLIGSRQALVNGMRRSIRRLSRLGFPENLATSLFSDGR